MVNRVKREFDKLKKDNDDTNNKLRILEDRSSEIIYVFMALKNEKINFGQIQSKISKTH